MLLDLARREVDTKDCHWVEQKFRRLRSMSINCCLPELQGAFARQREMRRAAKPCPKCKELIDIPAEALEVIVHEPEPDEGVIGRGGSRKKRTAVKLLPRTETRVSPLLLGGILADDCLGLCVGRGLARQVPGIRRLRY